jgi:hypothetical protein
MQDKVRTTIILPKATLRRAKLHSVSTGKTLSQFIAEAVDRALGSREESSSPDLPIGKYEWELGAVPSRKDIYAEALRSNVPA